MSAEQGGGSSPRVDSRQGEDGSIELVIDAPASRAGRARHDEDASSGGEPAPSSPTRKLKPWMAAPLLILVAALAFALTRSDEDRRVNTADDEPAGFRAYNGVGGAPTPEPAPQVAPARRAPVEPALSPEEEEAWRLAEQTNQDVVVEDEGVEEEEAPQRNSALLLPNNPARRLKPLNPMAIDTSRQLPFERMRMNTKQRALMRDAMRAQEGLPPLPPEPEEPVSPTLKTYAPKRMPTTNAPQVQPGFPEELPEHEVIPGDPGNIYGDGPSPYKTTRQ